jgi:molybdate transport repressor ModE-like protein
MTLPELMSLRLLCAIGNGGSISEAARSHGLSQPAASKRLAALERTMGVSLIERTRAGSRLSAEGLVVADWASRVLETVQQMSDVVATMRTHAAADFRLASSMTIAEHLVPDWLSALRDVWPDLHVGLRVTNSQSVQQLVIDGQVDLGLIESSSWDRRLEARELAHDRLAVVVFPDHRWARRRAPLTLEELAAEQLIVREPGSGTRESLDRLLDSPSRAEPLLEMGSNAAVKGAVRAGVGPAVLSLLAVRDELRSERLIEVEVAGMHLRRALYAVWPRGRRLGKPSLSLLSIASRYAADQGGMTEDARVGARSQP